MCELGLRVVAGFDVALRRGSSTRQAVRQRRETPVVSKLFNLLAHLTASAKAR